MLPGRSSRLSNFKKISFLGLRTNSTCCFYVGLARIGLTRGFQAPAYDILHTYGTETAFAGAQTLVCRIRGEFLGYGAHGAHQPARQRSNLECSRHSTTMRLSDNPVDYDDGTPSIFTQPLTLLSAGDFRKAANVELCPDSD